MKTFNYFTISFLAAFVATRIFVATQTTSPRLPSSESVSGTETVATVTEDNIDVQYVTETPPQAAVEKTPQQPAQTVTNPTPGVYSTTDIDTIYSAALQNEILLRQQAEANQALLSQAVQRRAAFTAANPRTVLWPGNQFDNDIQKYTHERNRIRMTRQNALQLAHMRIMLVYTSIQNGLSTEKHKDVRNKLDHLALTSVQIDSNSMVLYTHPQSTTPLTITPDPAALTLPTAPIGDSATVPGATPQQQQSAVNIDPALLMPNTSPTVAQ